MVIAMSPTPRTAKDIFLDLIAHVPPDQWDARLDQQCADDDSLRNRVRALLHAHANPGSFLDHPAILMSSPPFSGEGQPDLPIIDGPGSVIGPYKLLEQIGEGGFGVVFMAEQTEPVRRRVALKIIKPGMDTRQVIARFEAERQALALMDHPNIAKVLDAGTTGEVRNGEWGVRNEGISHSALPTPHSAGRPYFVMELVQGVPITDYCDQCQLTTRERLELFITVCQAVQHAHQKGVIHRDLKPTNILVAMQDGQPAPKIIDFGVAKALNQRLTEATLATGYAQMIGTPLYMSPEQAELSPLGADTRSDIYSLGVLLYELLTGTTPFEKERLHSASFDELRRILREEDPPRPSARLSSLSLRKRTGTQESSQPLFSKEGRGEGQERPGASETAALATTIANHRRTDPRRLIQTLRGELDWIVMKCLEKDRNRRYETANGLARDIERYLNNEPVQACPPSTTYRVRKFIRRNKLAVGFVLLLIAALGFLAVSNVLFKRERDAKAAALSLATKESAKATAIAQFLQEMLASANPDQAKGAEYTVRQLLDVFASGLTDQFAAQPEVEAELRATIGRAYWRLGMQGQSEAQLQRALELRRQAFGQNHPKVAESLIDYSWNLAEQRRHPEAEKCVREALAIYQQSNVSPNVLIHALWSLQRFLSSQRRFAEAEAVAKQALSLAGDVEKSDCADLANILHALADAKVSKGEYIEAEMWARRSVRLHRRLHGNDHPETAWGLVVLGRSLKGQRKWVDAESALKEALDIFRKCYREEHKSIQIASTELSSMLSAKASDPARNALAPERLEALTHRITQNPQDISAWIERAQAYSDLRRWSSALADLEKAMQRVTEDSRRNEIAVICHTLADQALKAGAGRVAEQAARSAIDAFRRSAAQYPYRDQHRLFLGRAQWQLAQIMVQMGRLREANEVLNDALGVFAQGVADFPAAHIFQQELAFTHRQISSLRKNQQFDEAVEHLRTAIRLYRELARKAPTNVFYRQEEAFTNWELAKLLEQAGRRDDAVAEFQRSVALHAAARAQFPREVVLIDRLAACRRDLATALLRTGNYREAAEALVGFAPRGEGYDPGALRNNYHFLSVAKNSTATEGHFLYRQAVTILEEAIVAAAKDVTLSATERDAFVDVVTRRIEELLSEAVQRCPSEPRVQEDFAWWLAANRTPRLHNPIGAVQLAEKAVAAIPSEFSFYTTLALARLRAGDDEGAINAAERSLRLMPAAYENFPILAMAHCRRRELDTARMWYMAELQRITHYGHPSKEDHGLLAEAKAMLEGAGALIRTIQQSRDELIAHYTEILESDPKASWAYVLRGQLYREAGRREQADTDLRVALEQMARNRNISLDNERQVTAIAAQALGWGHWDLAIAGFTRVIELNPEYYRSYQERGYAHLWLRDYEAALADYNQAIKLNPTHGQQWMRRGVVYSRLGQFEQALDDMQNGFELAPAHAWEWPWTERATVFLELGRWEEAFADLQSILAANPNDVVSHYRLALAALGASDVEGYHRACSTMIHHFGGTADSSITHRVAWTCALAPDAVQNLNFVVTLAEKAASQDPNNSQYATALGGILYRAGRWREAVERLSALDRSDAKLSEVAEPSLAHAWLFLAMAYDRLGNKDNALHWFTKATENSEEFLDADSAGSKRAIPWNQRLTFKLLYDEAKTLITPEPIRKDVASAESAASETTDDHPDSMP
jgi:serine/threonine protein kinase/tetratricopeptide (TPR) repeat protein